MSRLIAAGSLLTAFVALTPFSLPAAAAPGVAPGAASLESKTFAQPVACWWRHGVRRCDGHAYRRAYRGYGYGPSYGYRPSYGYSYGTPRPEDLRFGSTEWWRAMDREGRGGYRR